MSGITRRHLVRNVVAAGAAVGGFAAGTAGAAPSQRYAPIAMLGQDEPIEVVFSHIWGTPPGTADDGNKHPVELLIEAFNEQSDSVKVISQTNSGSYYENLQLLQAQLAAGNPDAMVITPWSNVNYASEGLGLINLDDIGGDELESVFSALKPEVQELVKIDGKTKGLPFAFSCPVIYYNPDIFAEAGVDPEVAFSTWDSFATEAEKLAGVLDGNPVLGFLGDRQWLAQSLIQSNGGFVLNDAGEPVMDSPEAVEAMQMVANLDQNGFYDSSDGSSTRASFTAGVTACWAGSIASLSGLRESTAFELKTSSFPTFGEKPRQMSSGGSFIGVYAQEEEQQRGSWEFLKFALSEPGYEIWMKTGYLNATTYDLPTLEGQEPAYEQLAEGLTRETPWPGARGGEILDIWATYCERIWANDIGAEEGCAEAVAEINRVLGN